MSAFIAQIVITLAAFTAVGVSSFHFFGGYGAAGAVAAVWILMPNYRR